MVRELREELLSVWRRFELLRHAWLPCCLVGYSWNQTDGYRSYDEDDDQVRYISRRGLTLTGFMKKHHFITNLDFQSLYFNDPSPARSSVSFNVSSISPARVQPSAPSISNQIPVQYSIHCPNIWKYLNSNPNANKKKRKISIIPERLSNRDQVFF